jgi:hypothetical protein
MRYPSNVKIIVLLLIHMPSPFVIFSLPISGHTTLGAELGMGAFSLRVETKGGLNLLPPDC